MKNKFVEITAIIEDENGTEHVIEKRVPVRTGKPGESQAAVGKPKPVDFTPPKPRRRKAS